MRAFVRFQKDPSSVRYASAAIISTITVLVIVGALLMRLFDPDNYPTFGGAVVVHAPNGDDGRLRRQHPDLATRSVPVAAIVMLVSISLITVITAVITSMFIRSVSREQEETDRVNASEALARIEASLASAHERLDRLTALATTPHSDKHTGE